MNDSLPILLLIHAAVTFTMTGVIWFVQLVHYPLFERVGASGFARYQQDHSRLTTRIVAPLMLLEALTMCLIAASLPTTGLVWLGAGLLVVIWASTFLLQVPQHRQLAAGFAGRHHNRLVASNWIRTAAWSLRSVVAILLVARMA